MSKNKNQNEDSIKNFKKAVLYWPQKVGQINLTY